MRLWAAALLTSVIVANASAGEATKKKVPTKTSTVSKRTVSNSKAARISRKGKRRSVAAAPSFQTHPDPARYTEIQRALAERGYFKGEANGEWHDDSTDALRRFQVDQKLPDDGKINSLSLTALGLGPRHDGSTAGAVPIAPPPPPVQNAPPATEEENAPPPGAGAAGVENPPQQ